MQARYAFGLAATLFAVSLAVAADPMKLPPLKKQPTVQKVIDEHVDALNKCDWNRLMAQYPNDVEIHLPDGIVKKGRDNVGELFAGFCKSRPDGLKGLKFTPESSFLVGNTLNVQWRAEAEFLSEPYKGSDAYVTRGGLMAAQVTTFDGSKLKSSLSGDALGTSRALRGLLDRRLLARPPKFSDQGDCIEATLALASWRRRSNSALTRVIRARLG